MLSMPCPNKLAILSTLSKPRATLSALPPPDGPPTCRFRREESLRALAVTCGGTKEEAVRRHCSAGRILVPPGRALTSHRRNPCPLCRPAPAGSQGGDGNGPVAGRLADTGKGVALNHRPGAPGSKTQGQARVGECHPPFAAARVRAANKRHATACRTWTPSGDHRVCARIAPPRACASHAHAYQPSSEASARARPSGPCFSPKPRRYPARDRRTLSIRKPYLTQLVRAANRTRSIASPAPGPVDFSPGFSGNCSVEEVLT